MNGLFVLTSPRKTDDPWHYVRAVFAAAEAEGTPNPRWLVVDGTSEQAEQLQGIAGPSWTVVRYERPDGQWLGGNKWPYWRMIELAHELTGPGDAALLLEDDLEFAPNSLMRMLTFPCPRDVSAVMFFNGFLFKQPKQHPGLWRTPAPVQGCQAIQFSRQTLELLVRWKAADFEWQKHNESDVALGVAQQRLRLRFAAHLPDVVQHVGSVSLVGHGMLAEAGITDPGQIALTNDSVRDRTSCNYAGPHFDCMRLYARHDLYL